jgi:hypothetical protein
LSWGGVGSKDARMHSNGSRPRRPSSRRQIPRSLRLSLAALAILILAATLAAPIVLHSSPVDTGRPGDRDRHRSRTRMRRAAVQRRPPLDPRDQADRSRWACGRPGRRSTFVCSASSLRKLMRCLRASGFWLLTARGRDGVLNPRRTRHPPAREAPPSRGRRSHDRRCCHRRSDRQRRCRPVHLGAIKDGQEDKA